MLTKQKNEHGTVHSYVIGFMLSVALTVFAYSLVELHDFSRHLVFSHQFLTVVVMGLSVMQLLVQLIFFLHLDKEAGSRWKTIVFLSTVPMLLLVVIGSIWIMTHLNYNMMPSDMSQDMQKEENIYK